MRSANVFVALAPNYLCVMKVVFVLVLLFIVQLGNVFMCDQAHCIASWDNKIIYSLVQTHDLDHLLRM